MYLDMSKKKRERNEIKLEKKGQLAEKKWKIDFTHKF